VRFTPAVGASALPDLQPATKLLILEGAKPMLAFSVGVIRHLPLPFAARQIVVKQKFIWFHASTLIQHFGKAVGHGIAHLETLPVARFPGIASLTGRKLGG
jgi:hypothetical protein